MLKEIMQVTTGLGRVSLQTDENAKRLTPWLYFLDIWKPGVGKSPAKTYTITDTVYAKSSGAVKVLPLDAIVPLIGFAEPLLCSAAKSDASVIKASFALIDQMLKTYEDNKVKAESAPVERKIPEVSQSMESRRAIVLKGTGEWPTLEQMLENTRANYAAIIAEAKNVAQENGVDILGQVRLKKQTAKPAALVAAPTEEAPASDDAILDLDGE
jgi:hypothetical protein